MTEKQITEVDLRWWLDLASTVEWTYARTYADTAPHHYVVHGRTPGLSAADYVRAARVIHTFGEPAKFYGMTSIYLTSPDGRVKWWTMDDDVRDTELINQATTDRLYGVQNAPSTRSEVQTPYDGIATYFDELHPTPDEMATALRSAVAQHSGKYPPSLLDIGCGTGRVLDLALTTPARYAGVDPSQPMLNQLVRKHPHVGALYPMRIEQALDAGTFTPGQFEIVTLLAGDDHDLRRAWPAVQALASRAVIRQDDNALEVVAVA